MATLFSAKSVCLANPDRPTCQRNFSSETSNELIFTRNATGLDPSITRNDNLYVSQWYGDDGTNSDLNVINGPNTIGSDLLYATQTKRDSFAAYSQGVWDFAENLTLTLGIRYAVDEVQAEENLFRYSETFSTDQVLARVITGDFSSHIDTVTTNALFTLNAANSGFQTDANGDIVTDGYGQPIPTENVVNGGIPFALSVYRPFEREDKKVTARIN